MTVQELEQALSNEGFDPEAYSLSGGRNWFDRYCLERRGRTWVVYFAERGQERSRREFQSESEACQHFLDWIRKDPTTRKRS